MTPRTTVMIENDGRRLEVTCYYETNERGSGWITEGVGTDLDTGEHVWLNSNQEYDAAKAAELKDRDVDVDD